MRKPLQDLFDLIGGKSPNSDQTWEQFEIQYEGHLVVFGTVLVWKVPNKLGGVMELLLIPPHNAIPHPPNKDYPNGYYSVVTYSGSNRTIISADNVSRESKVI